MPKVSNKIDYSTMPISFYKFVCQDDNVNSCYVGSTGNFRQRKHQHKHACTSTTNKKYNYLIYQTIREHGGWNNWFMVEIRNKLCDSKRDAERIEQELMTELKANMNSKQAFNTLDIKEYKRQYRISHAEHIKEHMKQYRLENADKINAYKKQYRIEHAEEINAKAKAKRQAKKECIVGLN